MRCCRPTATSAAGSASTAGDYGRRVAPLGWHRDFADARERLRYWVTACGTRGDRDRPTRQAAWPGEEPAPTIQDFIFTDRDTEFVEFVIAQVRKRQEAEDDFYASLDAGEAQ